MKHRAPPFIPTYQFTPAASKGNAFCWANPIRPSIFRGRDFEANVNGESASQVAARAVQEHEERTGRSRGTVFGISKASDKAAEEFTRRSMERRKARAAA